ncbi:MAG TPA: adenylate/guanylate cyclase domain-containing protein [Candidatus Limnocylindria bacterium]|nr:adenylate/guanylate cyclase domain-containing protein [Candidatus Limnocylindria bacterium]
MESDVNYARSGDVHLAYRVFGDGPHDLVLIPGTLSHAELYWEFPINQYLLKRLTSFARVIVFDKRGQGLSDRVAEQTLEERTGDVRAVMDAAGSPRATIFGWSEGGSMSLMFCATYPERTSALVVCGSFASIKAEPWAVSPKRWAQLLSGLETHWGKGVLVPINAPSRRDDEAFVQWFGRLERASASPGSILALMRANYDIDVRHVLPAIQAPTLVLHRVGDRTVPVEAGRYIAEHIRGARYVELPGDDHLLQAFDQETLDRLIDEIEEFITGARSGPEPDRVLVTVMFTDIVSSTERAAAVGDRRWRELLDGYVDIARRQLEQFRGREIDVAGDGLFAVFDGPARAIRCASAIRHAVRQLGLEVRAGLHTGECQVAGSKVSGIAVHTGARIAAAARPQEILVSGTVRDLVAGSGIRFDDRGSHVLKGVPGDWRLFAVASA